MKISIIIYLLLFVTLLSGSGKERKGSSSKRGKFNPNQYREVESSGTETEPTYIGGTGSSGPNVHVGAEPQPFLDNPPEQMQSHNKVEMKIFSYENSEKFTGSIASKLKE
uniref:Uncharacterized protein n=1 Tax=Meloidogyne enterolobii TaxID=390850 RepID=A0A6V7WYB5_MELEN|nr:unnamed protein product [Meloidogyne enterolobii]